MSSSSASSVSNHLQAAVASHKAGNLESAIAGYQRVLSQEPMHPDALNLCGVALSQRGDYVAAIPLLKKAVTTRPGFAEAAYNLGVAFQHTGAYADAAESLRQVLDVQPKHQKAAWLYATVCFESGDVPAAHMAFEHALRLQPDSVAARYQAGLFHLTCGDWDAGWDCYDARFDVIEAARTARRAEPPPYWGGQPLNGGAVLAWTEQGLGEEILACSALAATIAREASVTLECSSRMVPIVQRSLPDTRVVAWDDHERIAGEVDAFQFQYPALELTRRWYDSQAPEAASQACIQPDPVLRDRLRRKYDTLANGRRVIGVSWYSKNKDFGARKSLPLAALAASVSGGDVFLVSLQYDDHSQELGDLKRESGIDVYVDPEVDAVSDLEAAFAQCAAMDLIVTTSNSVAHMGGAVGVDTWVLLPSGFASPWFWLLERSDCLWYPSVRLFRSQFSSCGDWWEQPLAHIGPVLEEWLA